MMVESTLEDSQGHLPNATTATAAGQNAAFGIVGGEIEFGGQQYFSFGPSSGPLNKIKMLIFLLILRS